MGTSFGATALSTSSSFRMALDLITGEKTTSAWRFGPRMARS